MDEQTLNLLRRVSRYVFIGVAVLLVLLLLLALLRVSIGFWLWSTVETWATVRLGLDSDATQLVTTILVSVITLLLPTLAWYFLWGKKQLWATGAVVGGQILIFLLVSTIGSGVCFDRNTGEPLCWYADIPSEGRVFSRTKGFDPVTGEEYKQYTREVARGSISKITPSPITPISTSPKNQSETKTITLDAKRMWTDTGLNVTGKLVRIKYESGQWQNHPTSGWNKGDGLSPYNEKHRLIVPSGELASLVGKTDSGVFSVGTFYEGRAGSGRLFLSMNDISGYFNDNSGSLTVTINISD